MTTAASWSVASLTARITSVCDTPMRKLPIISLLKTKISTPNSTSNLTDKIEISTSELKEFDYTLKNELSKSFTIVNWYPSEIISINDMYALLTSYERQSNSDPVVLVKMYQFQNNDRTHSITMSYRITDKDKWEIIFEKILNSLTIKTFD